MGDEPEAMPVEAVVNLPFDQVFGLSDPGTHLRVGDPARTITEGRMAAGDMILMGNHSGCFLLAVPCTAATTRSVYSASA
ncbi:hypothetical protein GCM10018780_78030 [Streptomyces lanatus]|nr:hypothetical protein GCM10018780_78030 [Streptomyces lanatus]